MEATIILNISDGRADVQGYKTGGTYSGTGVRKYMVTHWCQEI
jgi:hypothetical protein